MMKRKYLLAILTIFIIHQVVTAQNHYLRGTVINKTSKQPVNNVNITILPDNKFGTITNKTGRFSIPVNNNKVVLKFAHIAFETKIVSFDLQRIVDTGLVITLTPKSYSLDEVVIKDKKFQTIYKKHNQAVIDYAIYNKRIFFLIRDYYESKTKILSVNENLKDTVFVNPPCKPKKLTVDFYGNLDVISEKDSVYQIVTSIDSIYFQKPFHYDKLSKLQELYDFKIEDKYYYSEFESALKDKIDYGYVDTINKKEIVFYSIFDDNKVDYYYYELCFLNLINCHNHVPSGAKRRRLVLKYYDSKFLYFDKNFFYNNILINFFHINDTIYIVDNVNNKLLKFNKNGKIISEIKMVCKSNDDKIAGLLKREEGRIWKNRVLTDKYDNENVYFFWREGNKTELYNLNVRTGIISFIKTLPHLFPIKITIYHNQVYYLYQKPGSLRNYGLYRTELKQINNQTDYLLPLH